MELSPGSFTGPDIVGEYVQKFVILKCHEQGGSVRIMTPIHM